MNRIPSFERVLAATFLLIAAGCGPTDVTAPDDAPAVVLGRVASVGAAAPAPSTAQTAGPSLHGSGSSLAGIEVRVEGESVATLTDDTGAFRLEVRAKDGRVRLRFRRGSMDVRLELTGIPPGRVLQIEVGLADDGATVLSSDDDGEDEFEGVATLLSLEGDAPQRTASLDVVGAHRSWSVDVLEGVTAFDDDGDLGTFDALVEALQAATQPVEIEGEGTLRDDGSIGATEVKAETEHADDDGEDDDHGQAEDEGPEEFEGAAALVSIDGEAPDRTARVELTGETGVLMVDIVEGVTTFDPQGDVLGFSAMLDALGQAGLTVEIEGEGTLQDDGSVLAAAVKVETDDGS